MKNQKEIVIMSAELSSNNSTTNEVNTNKLALLIKQFGLSFKRAKGVYKDVEETSFIIVVNDKDDLNNCLELAKTFNQEYILFSNYNRESSLLYCKGDKKEVGKLQPVLSTENFDSYTEVDGMRWVCI